MVAAVFVRELEDGQVVEQVLLVRESEVRSTRGGSDFLRLVLADRTGSVSAVLWDCPGELARLAAVGVALHVGGEYSVHARYGPQLKLRSLRVARPDEYVLEDLLDGPAHDVGQMERDLRELIATVQEPFLQALLERLLGEGVPAWAEYRSAPAAKYYHQAYRHGLLEHSLTVAQGVNAMAASFQGLDRDVAVTGALLHDVGKLDAYAFEGSAIDLTDAGRLQGEIALGYFRVRREIEGIEGFPPRLAQAILHIILSHHGSLEHGSPVVPCTREATLVHLVDNLGGKLGSFDRLEKELAEGQRWSGFDKALSAPAYFSAREAA
jgi:3'-5' exoribonuclease